MGIETRPLINLWFQVKHYPFWTNLSFACKIETLGSLYSHALLIPTKHPSPEIKWCINRSLMISQAANDKLVQKGECWIWNQRLIRGPGSILTGVTSCYWNFCFHVVRPLMTILALLPISGVSKNLYLDVFNYYWCRRLKSEMLHEF